ncbi:hypothetical protein HanXRQr2_Chr14g0645681 [Helianthus annuus]|uniref:Uncharacterized protein n=1 Tax=Helianthus annuus TaxID=4232 RepID=A0A9K3E8P2_HELAN|nr:hypothetical protein HanXRQr2_Chr14g0645681 [Helianthus annuus]KAJ0840500.1 hypothetical protein HanPSC8_Chr14g0619531 [Helianthus annuus]
MCSKPNAAESIESAAAVAAVETALTATHRDTKGVLGEGEIVTDTWEMLLTVRFPIMIRVVVSRRLLIRPNRPTERKLSIYEV